MSYFEKKKKLKTILGSARQNDFDRKTKPVTTNVYGFFLIELQ